MALISCPECGKEISDKAFWCVHCGYPMREGLFQAEAAAPERMPVEAEPEKPAPIIYVVKVTKFKSSKNGDVIEGKWPRAFPKIDTVCPGGTWRSVRYAWENNGKSQLFDKITIFNVKKQKICACRVYDLICTPGGEEIYIKLANYRGNDDYPSYVVLGDVETMPEDRASLTGIPTTGALKCPQCGSTSVTTGSRGLNWTYGALGASETVNRCAVCGFTWYPRG